MLVLQDYNSCGAKPNVDGVTTGSCLTIGGTGFLEAECKGGYCGAGIGGFYSGTPVCNITINSGNIRAIGRNNACGIGGGLRQPANNIVINGGDIYAKAGNGAGIGTRSAMVDNIIINGGNITASGGEYGPAIGGPSSGSGMLQINGGNITAVSSSASCCVLGDCCDRVIITGGTINTSSTRRAAISCDINGNIQITGGNIKARGKDYSMAIYKDENSIEENKSTDGTNNLYETQIELQDVEENKKISKITMDNINYGINDMYTLDDGMLYLYLPKGSRTITIEVDNKTYRGTIETTEDGNMILLKQN